MGSLGQKLFEFQTKDLLLSLCFELKGYLSLLSEESFWSLIEGEFSDLSHDGSFEALFVEPAISGGFIVGMRIFVAEEKFLPMNDVRSQVIYLKKGSFQGDDGGIAGTAPQVFEGMPLRHLGSGMVDLSQGLIYEFIGLVDSGHAKQKGATQEEPVSLVVRDSIGLLNQNMKTYEDGASRPFIFKDVLDVADAGLLVDEMPTGIVAHLVKLVGKRFCMTAVFRGTKLYTPMLNDYVIDNEYLVLASMTSLQVLRKLELVLRLSFSDKELHERFGHKMFASPGDDIGIQFNMELDIMKGNLFALTEVATGGSPFRETGGAKVWLLPFPTKELCVDAYCVQLMDLILLQSCEISAWHGWGLIKNERFAQYVFILRITSGMGNSIIDLVCCDGCCVECAHIGLENDLVYGAARAKCLFSGWIFNELCFNDKFDNRGGGRFDDVGSCLWQGLNDLWRKSGRFQIRNGGCSCRLKEVFEPLRVLVMTYVGDAQRHFLSACLVSRNWHRP